MVPEIYWTEVKTNVMPSRNLLFQPTVLDFFPDSMCSVSGAHAPRLLGAACRPANLEGAWWNCDWLAMQSKCHPSMTKMQVAQLKVPES